MIVTDEDGVEMDVGVIVDGSLFILTPEHERLLDLLEWRVRARSGPWQWEECTGQGDVTIIATIPRYVWDADAIEFRLTPTMPGECTASEAR